MSRGGLLSVFAMAVVYAYRFRLKVWGLALISAATAALLLAAPSLFFQRIANAVDSGGAGRTNIWKVGLVALKHYGIMGAGLGNFPAAFDHFAGEAAHFEGFDRGSHNIYLNVSVELGILGVILLVNALRTELRGRKFADVISPFHAAVACEAAAWGMLVGGFFLDILWKKAFWLVWILFAVATKMQKASAEIPEPRRS
jgi:O-antigen ligase